jgi:hypothetical protein
MRRDSLSVIPGRRKAASPKSIFQNRGHGFRARAFGASRNDNNQGDLMPFLPLETSFSNSMLF